MNPFTPKRDKDYDEQRHRPKLRDNPLWDTVGEVAGGTALLAFGALVALGVWCVGVVALWPGIALGAMALILAYVLIDAASTAKRNRVAMLVSGAAALLAIVWGYAAMVAFGAESVALPGWIATALYGVTLAIGVWQQLERAERIIAAIFGLLMVAVATSLLVIPGRGEAGDEPPGFSVEVVIDDERVARSDIVVNCTLLDAWSVADGAMPEVDPKIADDMGRAGPWKFAFGHPLKAVVCTAVGRQRSDDGAERDETRTVADAVYFPMPGGSYTVRLALFDSDRL